MRTVFDAFGKLTLKGDTVCYFSYNRDMLCKAKVTDIFNTQSIELDYIYRVDRRYIAKYVG